MKLRTNKKLWLLAVAVWAILMLVFVVAKADNAYVAAGIGAGKNGNAFRCSICWEDQNVTGSILYLRYKNRLYQFSDTGMFSGIELWWGVEVNHFSHWEVGPPFNDTHESSLDSIMAVIEFRSNLQ